MTEERGRYNRRPRQCRPRSSEPEPLGELLHRYAEERRWTHLLPPPGTNGHQPAEPTTVRRRDG